MGVGFVNTKKLSLGQGFQLIIISYHFLHHNPLPSTPETVLISDPNQKATKTNLKFSWTDFAEIRRHGHVCNES
jgi:hypothetical protein